MEEPLSSNTGSQESSNQPGISIGQEVPCLATGDPKANVEEGGCDNRVENARTGRAKSLRLSKLHA